MELTIVDQNGWKKPIKLEKAVNRVGSNPASDIQLISAEIAPVHLQIIQSPDTPASCKVLNLGSAVQWLAGGQESVVEPYGGIDVRDGNEIILGAYRIVFHLPISGGLLSSSQHIAASFVLADATLRPDVPTVGMVHLKNLGDSPQCQFQFTLTGLPEACFRIDPPPMLYSGGEDDVRIQFFHQKTFPAAGVQTITLIVTAPGSYPGEQVTIQQGLYVTPVLSAALHLTDDLPVPVEPAASPTPARLQPETLPEKAAPVMAESHPPAVVAPPEPEPALQAAFALPEQVPSKKETTPAKVVKNPSESYWDE